MSIFKRRKISPEYLYLAIYTLQKKFRFGFVRNNVAWTELREYLGCSPLMLTSAINRLEQKGWIRPIESRSKVYRVTHQFEHPSLVDVRQKRIAKKTVQIVSPDDFGYEGRQ